MNITLRQLDAFLEVAKSRNFSRAAAALNVSQPALTLMIQKLERQLDVVLFQRLARGAELTTAARELLPDVQRAVATLEDMVRDLHDSSRPRGGLVTIASVPSLCADVLPRLIAEFVALHPQIRVLLKDAMTENRAIVNMVRIGDIDFGFSSFSDDDEGLVFEPLVRDAMVAVVSTGHVFARRKKLRWTELSAHPLIGMGHASHVRLLVDEAFAHNGLAKRPRYEASIVATAVGMARAGLGVAVVPDTAVLACNLAGVVRIALTEPIAYRPMGFILHSRRGLSPAASLLMAFMKERTPQIWTGAKPG
ncbi:MAG TPA: LysR family transcriptional regulator [Burkholderiaceae bacterium]|jgi:DNA-binding transcriptional LysR family regulator